MLQTAQHAHRAAAPLSAHGPRIDVDRVDDYLRAHVPVRWKTARARPGSIDAAAAAVCDALLDPSLCATPVAERDAMRPALLAQVAPFVTLGSPVDLYLDLGHGYRAGILPGRDALTFEVGLGEWFLLGQIARLGRGVAALYAPGVRLHLIVDNLFASVVYRVPLADTERYCAWLRALIAATGLDQLVRVLVESEQVDEARFSAELEADLTSGAAEPATASAQACLPSKRHAAASAISHRLLSTWIDGPRLNLHATPSGLARGLRFRAYPGGDGRLGAGETCLAEAHGRLRPTILTRLNSGRYLRTRMTAPPCLPDLIRAITIASPWH